MRYVIYILVFTLISASLKAQLPSNTFISRNFTGNTKAQWILLDSPVVNPILDTFYARYPGTQIVRIQGGDTSFWFYGGNRRWFRALQAPDTVSLSNRINFKLNISDTASMLSPYLRKVDTTNIWVTSVFRKTASDSVFYVKGGSNVFAFKDSIGGGGSGTVTSVALSMPSAFTVSGSPITTSGTFNVSGAGTSLQYIRGDGTLATFDTTAIPNFYIKARSLLSGTSPITYNSTTGAIGINNATASGTKGAATFVNSSFSDNGLGTIDLKDVTSAGTCINCDITFDAKGRAISYASGTPPNFVNAPGAGDTLSFLDTLKRLNAGFGILHTVTNYNITQKVDTSVIATPYDLTQLSFPNSNIGSGYRWAVPNTNNIKTVFASNTILWDSTSNSNGLTPKADTSVLATQYDLTAKQNVMLSDLGRLQQIKTYVPANGTNASATYSASYPASSIDTAYFKYTTSGVGNENGGWLVAGTSGDSVQVTAPFWVIFANSIGEGHPGRHGRLHPLVAGVAQNIFIYDYPDSVGQLSYHLRALTNMRWYNHGIGSQTTVDLRKRFMRDVIADSVPSMADGRGNRTLNQRPQGVIIEAGINDIFNGVSAEVTKANLEWMAATCQAYNMRCVFLNIPGDAIANQSQLRLIASMNEWFKSGVMDQYDASVVDFNNWWNDPTYGNDNIHHTSLIVDDIHPSMVGYDSLANYIFRSAKLPVLTKAIFINELSPLGFTGYSRPANITINGNAYTLTNATDSVNITTFIPDSTWIKIITSTNITGTTYTGFSHILWKQDNNVEDSIMFTRRTFYNSSVSYPSLSGFDVVASKPSNNLLVARIRMQDLNETFRALTSSGGGTFIFNGLANTTALSSAVVSIYGSTGLGMNGNIKATGTSHQLGVLEVQQNGTPTTTGFGVSAANTLSSIALYGTAQKNKDLIRITTWNGANTGLGSTAHTNILSITNTGFSNPDGSNQVGNALSITPQINDTSTLMTGIQIRGIYYNPIRTSLTNVRHFGIWVGSGNNYFNVKGDSTCFGCDSSTFVNARFRVNGSVRLDSVVAPAGAYTVLVHDADSIVKQVPASTFATGNTLYTGDGTLAGNRTVTANNLNLTFNDVQTFRINYDTYIQSKADGTFPYTNTIVAPAQQLWMGYTPTAGTFSKGSAIVIDTNNNVALGTSTPPTTAPLYADGAAYIHGLQSGRGNFYRVSDFSADHTMTNTEYWANIDASGGNITITLPAASTVFGSSMGIQYVFKRTDASGNTVTVQRNGTPGTDTIDGAASFTIVGQYTVKEVQCISTSAFGIK